MDDDFDVSRPDLMDDLADAVEVGMEQERLPHGLVVDRRIREANLEGPQITFADRQATSNRPEPLRDPLHVVAEREMVLEQGLEAALERLIVDPKQGVHERFDIDLAGVDHGLVQDAIGVRPPEPHEMPPVEQRLEYVAEADAHHVAKASAYDREAS